jgi:Flp pilus assembly protein CpaB
MEMEYKDPSKRGRWIVVIGVVLAIAAGGAAFFLINQAQQQAGQGGLQKVAVVVAARPIPARKPIEADDVTVREIPVDPTNQLGIVSTPDKVIGRVLAVSVLQDQMVTTNLLASEATGGQFSILSPGESLAPGTDAWRAVAITVPDDRAVGGLVLPGMTVDVFISATVLVPQSLLDSGRYYTDKSTKISYQNMLILAKTGTFYIVKATVSVAEEIVHLQASGTATFSMALRPDTDVRPLDASKLGETTNRIIARYGLPIPEAYPPGTGPIPTPQPTPTPAPTASAGPSASAAPSGSRAGRPPVSVDGSHDLVPERGQPRSRIGGRAGRVDDPAGCRAKPFDDAPLRGDPAVGIVGVRAAGKEPLALDPVFARHQPDLVAQLGETALDQLDRLDRDGLSCRSLGILDRAEDRRPNGRMDDRLEGRQLRGISEHDPGESGSIERAVRATNRLAEPGQDRVVGRLPRSRHPPSDVVGVNDDSTVRPEPAGDGRFPAPDRPGQPDPECPPALRRLACLAGLAAHGARSSSSSHASSMVASACSTSASSLATRRISTKFEATPGVDIASSS